MTQMVDLKAMEDRQREIRAEIEKLEAEYADIDSAIRVVMRFIAPQNEAPAEQESKLGPKRPEGIPSNFEMAETILQDAAERGRRGLTAAEMIEEIGKRWWPGVQGQQIMPIMYGFAKKGRLIKGGDGYFRLPMPQTEEAPTAQAEEASKPEEIKGSNLDDLLA